MRKMLSVFFAVALLVCCSVPALAVGGNDTGTVLYTPAPFDEWYTDVNGGPYEWLFNFYRQPSAASAPVRTDFVYERGNFPYYEGYTSVTAAWFTGVIKVFEDDFTLVANNKFFRISACDSYLMTFNPEMRIKAVRIYGAYLIATRDANGEIVFIRQNFSYDHQFGDVIARNINLGQELRLALENKTGFDETGMFFEKLSVDFACERLDVDTPSLTVQYPRSDATSVVYDFRSWVNMQLDKFDTSAGTTEYVQVNPFMFLGDTANSFLATEIFNGFSFGDVLGIVFALGVLFFALKMLI